MELNMSSLKLHGDEDLMCSCLMTEGFGET